MSTSARVIRSRSVGSSTRSSIRRPRRQARSPYVGPIPRPVVPTLAAAEARLVALVERHVVRHDHVRAAADADLGHVDALGGEHVQLADQRRRVDHHAVADDRRDVRVHHPRRAQLELERLVAHDHRVAGVVAALVADHHRGLLGEEVGGLPLALVPPLEADDHGRGHARASGHKSTPARAGVTGRRLPRLPAGDPADRVVEGASPAHGADAAPSSSNGSLLHRGAGECRPRGPGEYTRRGWRPTRTLRVADRVRRGARDRRARPVWAYLARAPRGGTPGALRLGSHAGTSLGRHAAPSRRATRPAGLPAQAATARPPGGSSVAPRARRRRHALRLAGEPSRHAPRRRRWAGGVDRGRIRRWCDPCPQVRDEPRVTAAKSPARVRFPSKLAGPADPSARRRPRSLGPAPHPPAACRCPPHAGSAAAQRAKARADRSKGDTQHDEQGPPHRSPHPRPRAAHHRRRQGGGPVLRGLPRVRRAARRSRSSTTSSRGTASPRRAAGTSARASRSRSRAGSRRAPGTTTRASATGRRRSSPPASRCSRAPAQGLPRGDGGRGARGPGAGRRASSRTPRSRSRTTAASASPPATTKTTRRTSSSRRPSRPDTLASIPAATARLPLPRRRRLSTAPDASHPRPLSPGRPPRRTGAGAGSRSRRTTRRAASPAPCRRRPAAGPPRARRPSTASTALPAGTEPRIPGCDAAGGGINPTRPPAARVPALAPPAQPTTITTSPRAGIEPSAASAASSPRGPRTIVSWSFVSSRHTAPGRSGPQAAARSRSVAAIRPGASNTTLPRSSAAIPASRSRRSRPLRGQEPLERPARARDPGRGDGGQHGRGAGHRDHGAPRRGPGGHQPLARVGHDGRARVGDQREVGAAGEVREELALLRGAALRVVAGRVGRDLVALEEPAGDPRVLGGDQRHGAQDLERPERDVAEVPDRRRDDVQGPAGRAPWRRHRPASGARTRCPGRPGDRARRAGRPTRRPPRATLRTGPRSPADAAGTGSPRRRSAARASRSAGPGA